MSKGNCHYCGKEFVMLSNVQIYCSGRCRNKARRNKENRCVYNDGVGCGNVYGGACKKCAWNPGSGVSENRLAIFLAGGSW